MYEGKCTRYERVEENCRSMTSETSNGGNEFDRKDMESLNPFSKEHFCCTKGIEISKKVRTFLPLFLQKTKRKS
jgi:hypothetical protein